MQGRRTAITWRVLLDCGIQELPVRVSVICRVLGVRLCSYAQGYPLIRQFGLGAHTHGSDGFLFRMDKVPVIFYNQSRPVGRQRFTVAHELGHLLLGHTGPLLNREPDPGDSPTERAANAFAGNLLAPACVLRALEVQSAFSVARLCDLTPRCARFRMEQLSRLYEKDAQWLEERGRSYFFQSPAEWTLYRRFEPFIRAEKAREQALFGSFTAPRPCGAGHPEGCRAYPAPPSDTCAGWSSRPAP